MQVEKLGELLQYLTWLFLPRLNICDSRALKPLAFWTLRLSSSAYARRFASFSLSRASSRALWTAAATWPGSSTCGLFCRPKTDLLILAISLFCTRASAIVGQGPSLRDANRSGARRHRLRTSFFTLMKCLVMVTRQSASNYGLRLVT